MASSDAGAYTKLENAIDGQVVVRFPPEASGYLHIGHAKAALLNYHYKQIYNGKLVMRFDDTNPEKEKEDYEKVILDDVASLGIQYDILTYTSDHFEKLLELCTDMIKNGQAFVDDTPAEEMKIGREKRQPSKCHDQSVEQNLAKWQEMIKGSEDGQKCCVRAKLDFASKNGCLRDPTMYRCKNESHPRTKDKFKVYPTYDFACPVVDSVEGVTHALRTTEYLDRDPQYYWFLDTLGLRKPTIASYSRLNMMNTVLSKRKLTWIVDEKYVTGWDDPRMPTVQGILRRGLTVEGLKQFIITQGSSRSIVFMEWDKIWAINKKHLDPIVPRFTAIEEKDAVEVELESYDGSLTIDIAVHPKDEKLGKRQVKVSKELLIEQVDAETLKEGITATMLGLGNVKIVQINKNENGKVQTIKASLDLDNKDFKKTPKLSWLSKDRVIHAKLIYYDHIITKSLLGKDEEFKDFVNKDSKVEIPAYVDVEAKDFSARTIIQFQRKGNFICDFPFSSGTLIMNYIPDGTSKSPYTTVVVSSGKVPQTKEASGKANKEKKAKEPKEKQQQQLQQQATPKQQQASAPVATPKEPVDPAKAALDKVKRDQEKAAAKAKKKEAHEAKSKAKPASGGDAKGGAAKKQTKLGIESKKEDNFANWYTEVIVRGEMIEYYDVSGCYIFRPWSYAIWERIQAFFDAKIKSIGVENCYFPMFVSQSALEKEKNHIADFAPEVAWVTKSGQSEMAEPIAIRPTSETVMYPAFSKWVQSYRDLPIRLNQWNNVVRWEFKDPTPFIRTREFLWQEGHTAFATKAEAIEEVDQILEFYASVYEDLLAIPVVRGRKSEKEKFPGADFTLTVEGFIETNGRGIQGATSHHLGQNFSKMFNICFQDPNDSSKREFAYQNSWGLSTRTIGVLIMTHSDNKGLVLPPRVSPIQVVVIPVGITASTTPEAKTTLLDACKSLHSSLLAAGIRCKLDSSDHISPGWKFNQYELKGVCVRVELGPKDLEKSQIIACRRDNGDKLSISIAEAPNSLANLLEEIQKSLYDKAKIAMDSKRVQVTDWQAFLTQLNDKCTLVAPFCGRPACEDNIKKDSVRESKDGDSGPLMGAKSLCIPKRQPETKLTETHRCIHPDCSEKPNFWCLFGRSY